MFPFASAFVKPAIARQKAQKIIERLDAAIREAERQEQRSLLDGLAGVERFNAAAALLTSTLLVRAGTREGAADRAALISRYLQQLQEEYEMAVNDLKQVPASRAEVVALGLAVKEVALSLDTELADFRGTADKAVRELHDTAAATRADALRKVERATAELQGQVARVQAEQEQRLDGLRRVLQSGLQEQRHALQSTAQDLRATVEGVSHELQERIAAHHVLHLQQFEELRTAQGVLQGELTRVEEQLRHWIYAVLTLAAVAFGIAVAAL